MKNRVDRAIEIISGYCSKVIKCDECRYGTINGECALMQCIPCDWGAEKMRGEDETDEGVGEK